MFLTVPCYKKLQYKCLMTSTAPCYKTVAAQGRMILTVPCYKKVAPHDFTCPLLQEVGGRDVIRAMCYQISGLLYALNHQKRGQV